MTNLFIIYVAAFFLPVLFNSWRMAVLGLGVQGFLLALILAASHGPLSWPMAFEFMSLFVIRAIFVPWYLSRQMRDFDRVKRFSLIPKNLLQWSLALALLGVSFLFGHKMAPTDPLEAMQFGTASGSILIGLQILASQNHPLGQIVGLLTFEGGVTLVELLSPHAMPFPVSLGVSLVTVTLVLVCGKYLSRILAIPGESGEPLVQEAQ